MNFDSWMLVRLIDRANELGVTTEDLKQWTGEDKPLDELIAWLIEEYSNSAWQNEVESHIKRHFEFIAGSKLLIDTNIDNKKRRDN